jgi:hypothetical protein
MRDAILLSLDKEKIIAFSKLCNIPMPEDDLIFWAGIHKAVLAIKNATPEQKAYSERWLAEHNFIASGPYIVNIIKQPPPITEAVKK